MLKLEREFPFRYNFNRLVFFCCSRDFDRIRNNHLTNIDNTFQVFPIEKGFWRKYSKALQSKNLEYFSGFNRRDITTVVSILEIVDVSGYSNSSSLTPNSVFFVFRMDPGMVRTAEQH